MTALHWAATACALSGLALLITAYAVAHVLFEMSRRGPIEKVIRDVLAEVEQERAEARRKITRDILERYLAAGGKTYDETPLAPRLPRRKQDRFSFAQPEKVLFEAGDPLPFNVKDHGTTEDHYDLDPSRPFIGPIPRHEPIDWATFPAIGPAPDTRQLPKINTEEN